LRVLEAFPFAACDPAPHRRYEVALNPAPHSCSRGLAVRSHHVQFGVRVYPRKARVWGRSHQPPGLERVAVACHTVCVCLRALLRPPCPATETPLLDHTPERMAAIPVMADAEAPEAPP
jgi:hypothetical protein